MRRVAGPALATLALASCGLAAAAPQLEDARRAQWLPFTGGGDGTGEVRPAEPATAPESYSDVGLAARVVRPTLLRSGPMGRPIVRLSRKTVFGSRQTLAVTERRDDWVAVLHSSMPNGRSGWLPRDAVRLHSEPLNVEVDLSERMASVRRHGKVIDRFRVGIGRSSSPTPTGRFAITDRLLAGPGLPYGCCVLALSGRQPNLPAGWPGGDRLAFHGVADESRVGRATSYGCLHVRERDLRVLIRRLRVGTRVEITA